jgi:hypothetical protein
MAYASIPLILGYLLAMAKIQRPLGNIITYALRDGVGVHLSFVVFIGTRSGSWHFFGEPVFFDAGVGWYG